MFPVELLPELREHIVNFVGVWEFLSLTLTCQQALRDVESFSRSEVDRIEREHNVDDTWRFRVGMQVEREAAERVLQEQDNGHLFDAVEAPDTVSHRRLLRAAYCIHLYSLEMHTRRGAECRALAMHPNGKELLCGGHLGNPDAHDDSPGVVQLCDLSTKQCIRSCIGHTTCVSHVGFSAGHMVSSSSRREATLRIWSMDGGCQHDLNLPVDRYVYAQAATDDTVYVAPFQGPIYAIDTIRGTIRCMEQQPWDTMDDEVVEFPTKFRVCKNYVLHLKGDCRHRDQGEGDFRDRDLEREVFVATGGAIKAFLH